MATVTETHFKLALAQTAKPTYEEKVGLDEGAATKNQRRWPRAWFPK